MDSSFDSNCDPCARSGTLECSRRGRHLAAFLACGGTLFAAAPCENRNHIAAFKNESAAHECVDSASPRKVVSE